MFNPSQCDFRRCCSAELAVSDVIDNLLHNKQCNNPSIVISFDIEGEFINKFDRRSIIDTLIVNGFSFNVTIASFVTQLNE